MTKEALWGEVKPLPTERGGSTGRACGSGSVETRCWRFSFQLEDTAAILDSELAPIPWTLGLSGQRTIARVGLDFVRGSVAVV